MKKIITLFTLIALICLFSMGNTGCETQTSSNDGTLSRQEEQSKIAKNLSDKYKIPVINDSLEIENIIRRAKFINQKNRISYLYLLTENGQLIREEQVLGKISSLNSYMTPMEEYKNISGVKTTAESYLQYSAPDIDGSYGENAGGIFWFTPDGVYREWDGRRLFSSERLSFEVKPILTESK